MKRQHREGGSCLPSSLNGSVTVVERSIDVSVCVCACLYVGKQGDKGIPAPGSGQTDGEKADHRAISFVCMSILSFSTDRGFG